MLTELWIFIIIIFYYYYYFNAALQVKTALPLDVRQLLMLFARTLTYVEANLLLLIIFYNNNNSIQFNSIY
jgi:hypothetical protein